MDYKQWNVPCKLAHQCAPLFMGLKISNLLILKNHEMEEAKKILEGLPLSVLKLYREDLVTISFLYQEQRLTEYLNRPDCREYLERQGYQAGDMSGWLFHLRKRFLENRLWGSEFPHELGLFLGYPLSDVEGFVKHHGGCSLLTGYWKVYDQPEKARALFINYDRARSFLISLVQSGESLENVCQIASCNRPQSML